MKKAIKSLAVLSMILTAAVITSCNKAEVEQSASDRVATITIAPPAAAETKVAIDDGETKVSITGWESGDVVTLYKFYKAYDDEMEAYFWFFNKAAFTCTDPGSCKFTGVLPAGVTSVDEFNVALYNCSLEDEDATFVDSQFYYVVDIKASPILKDVIAMAALKDSEGKFTMKVINNIVAVKNNTVNDIEAAWQLKISEDYRYLRYFKGLGDVSPGKLKYNNLYAYDQVKGAYFDDNKFTLLAKTVNYLTFNTYNDTYSLIGLSAAGDAAGVASLIDFKNSVNIPETPGVLYTAPDIN